MQSSTASKSHLRRFGVVLVLTLIASLAGCGDAADDPSPAEQSELSSPSGTITVSAASSLTGVLTQVGADFTDANPDAIVDFNFAASSTLATQIISGAPSDVFASADEANMDRLAAESLLDGEPVVFARNEMVIVTKPGNPQQITELADLAGAGVISLCGEEVPCGRYAAQILAEAGVEIPESSITRGDNVASTLAAVTRGDAVAAIVYATDSKASTDLVETVVIPAEVNVVVSYPIAVLSGSREAVVARAFVDYLTGAEAVAIFEEYGFLAPR